MPEVAFHLDAKRECVCDMTFLDFFPILVAVVIWGMELANKRVCFRSNNVAVVHVINHQPSRSHRVMMLERAFVL